jgi:protein-S-isoprenylcysteine O-methyltransferase Ste14
MALIAGQEVFLERSELNKASNGFMALATVVVSVGLCVLFFILFDGLFIGSTLISEAVIICTGQLLVAQMILRRADFKRRWGNRAFSIAFRSLAIPGVTFILAGVVHFGWIEGRRIVPHVIAAAPVAYLLVSGAVLWLRAAIAFGIDNLSLMYVYFPSESRLVRSNVCSVLRHPVYSAVLRIIFAVILWNGSLFALIAGCIAPLAMTAWLRWAEEPELIDRFGGDYRAYRRGVPAFFNPRPRLWVTLWRFLVKGA